MITENEIVNLTSDVKFMQRLEDLLPALQRIRQVKNILQSIASRSGEVTSEYIMLEGLYILQKRSNLTKSQRDTILNIINFTVEEYDKWKNGEETRK